MEIGPKVFKLLLYINIFLIIHLDKFADRDLDEPENERQSQKLYGMADFTADMRLLKKKSAKENAFIERVSNLRTVEAVRQYFLPDYLMQYVGDIRNGWRHKLTASMEFVPTVLKFFARQNSDEFVQQLSPQSNIKRRYVPLTTTILSAIWCDFLRQNRQVTVVSREECKSYCYKYRH